MATPNPAILTEIGRAKLLSASPENPVKITHFAAGDGDGGYSPLNDQMTSLVNERARVGAVGPIRRANERSLIGFQGVFTSAAITETFIAREVAVFDEAGDMIAIGQIVEIAHPADDDAFESTLGLYIETENTENITAVLDTSLLPTMEYLDTRLAEKADKATRIVASTGLTGTGDLSEDVTLKADFALQSEAEDEQNLTKVMSPRRVWQAIAKWYDGKFSTFIKTMLGRSSAAQVRNDLGLKSAALHDVTTTRTDITEGRLLEVRDFGIGELTVPPNHPVTEDATLDVQVGGGIYRIASASDLPSSDYGPILSIPYSTNGWSKVHFYNLSDRVFVLRKRVDTLSRFELLSTSNITDSTGDSAQYPMSQKAVTDALALKADSNDPRLENAREWTATVVSQAEAEAGTHTTARKWTAQRVWQAAAAQFNAVTTSFTRTLLGRTSAAQVRNDLQLKSAALRDVGTGDGNVLVVGDAFGLGVRNGIGSRRVKPEDVISSTSFWATGTAANTHLGMTKQYASVLAMAYSTEGDFVSIQQDITDGSLTLGGVRNGEQISPRAVIDSENIRSSTGSSPSFPMSQKAVTDALNTAGTPRSVARHYTGRELPVPSNLQPSNDGFYILLTPYRPTQKAVTEGRISLHGGSEEMLGGTVDFGLYADGSGKHTGHVNFAGAFGEDASVKLVVGDYVGDSNNKYVALEVWAPSGGAMDRLVTFTGNHEAIGDHTLKVVGMWDLSNASDFKPDTLITSTYGDDKVITEDVVYTVGLYQDFLTINEALEYLSRRYPAYKKGGVKVGLRLASGFEMREQVLVDGIDLGWITITSVDSIVQADLSSIQNPEIDPETDYVFLFWGRNNAVLPNISAFFNFRAGALGSVFALVSDFSSLTIEEDAGCNSPSSGFHARGKSKIKASLSKFEAMGRPFLISSGSHLEAEGMRASVSGHILRVDGGSTTMVNDALLEHVHPTSDSALTIAVSGFSFVSAERTNIPENRLSQPPNVVTADGCIRM